MKKSLIAAMLAMTFAGGAFAAHPKASEDTRQVGNEKRIEDSKGHDVKADLSRSGVSMWLEDLQHAAPLSDLENTAIWTFPELTPAKLARQRIGGDLQAYRMRRLNELRNDRHPGAQRAHALLSQISDDAGIKQWANREVVALYIQALQTPTFGTLTWRDAGGLKYITTTTYKQVTLPVAYRWSQVASTSGCALKNAIEVKDAQLAEFAGTFTEAFFTADNSLFQVPSFDYNCQASEGHCQPYKFDPSEYDVALLDVKLKIARTGVTYQDGRGVVFDRETVCAQKWTYSESTSAGNRKSKSHTIGDTTSSGRIVIHREKLRARAED